MKNPLAIAALLLLAGCPRSEPAPEQRAPLRQEQPVALVQNPQPAHAQDPEASVPVLISLHIYQLAVPFGTVSNNEDFWKRVDEQSVDVATYDLLYRNGIRVGQAAIAEWDFFKNIIDQNPAVSKYQVVTANEVKSIELEMNAEVPTQNIFFFDSGNVLIGRSYDRCTNFMSLSFQPRPRKLGDVRVALCPTVRTMRKVLEFNALQQPHEYEFVRPEHLYEMNLRADIPLDSFLIIAPSPDGRWPSSLGNIFLTKEGNAEKYEQILLLVPKPYRLDDPDKAK
jgi:hypothetical protein